MPQTMTYTSLVTDIEGYSERTNNNDDFVEQIPRLIMMAENRIATELKILGFQTVVAGNFLIGEPIMPKPAYWRNTISFNYTDADGNRVEILPRSYEYCRNFWPNSSETGSPRFYADYNFNNLLIVPTPELGSQFEFLYDARLQPLDQTNSTNWMTANAPQLLLYASMVEAQLYLKNFEKMQFWQATYDRSLAAFNSENVGRISDRTTVNNG